MKVKEYKTKNNPVLRIVGGCVHVFLGLIGS